MAWNRKLWGVEFISGMPGDKPMLIGTTWMRPMPKPQYCDEPTRAILFNTRAIARNWCRDKMAEYAGREDCCAQWRLLPVRVQETVTKVSNMGIKAGGALPDQET